MVRAWIFITIQTYAALQQQVIDREEITSQDAGCLGGEEPHLVDDA